MGIIVRQSIKSSVVAYLGVAIGAFNNLWLYTKFLTATEVGLLRVLPEAAILAASITLMGLPNASMRFFPSFEKQGIRRERYFPLLNIISMVLFLFFAGGLILFKDQIIFAYQEKSPLLGSYYYFVLPLIFVICGQSLFETYCAIYDRITMPTVIREIFLKLSNSAVIILFGCGIIDLMMLMTLLAISYLISLFLLAVYMQRLFEWKWIPDPRLLNIKTLSEIMKYGGYVFLVGFGIVITTRIDLLMIPAYLNLEYTGIYGIAVFFALVVEIPKRGISRIASPIISKTIQDNDIHSLKQLYQKSSINQLLAGIGIFGLIAVNIDSIYALMPKGQIYSAGKYAVLILGVSKIFDLALGLNGEILGYSNHYKSYFYSTILLAILTVLTNMALIPLLGIEGAALATTISVGIYSLIKLVLVWYFFKILPFTTKTWLLLAVTVLATALSCIVPVDNMGGIFDVLLGMTVRSSVFCAVLFALTVRLNISTELNSILLQMITKIARR